MENDLEVSRDCGRGGNGWRPCWALRDGIRSVLSVPLLADTEAIGEINLASSTPQAFTAFIKSEIAKWTKVIRAVGLENTQ